MTDTAEHLPLPLARRHLALDNGLAVTLLQVPQALHCAAWVRVAAGSHDEPRAYAGLAHFLEHLLFLDSAHFATGHGLMAFVQAAGGQVNASTQARHTDFFCEVPPAALDGALARLFDMLAAPALDPEAQRREREVLQAEFLARSEDRETLMDAALGLALVADHPFGDFHAGNRDTLPVEDAGFQQALCGFHRRFYQAGQAHLLIAGAQPLDELAALAERHGQHLPRGEPMVTPAPPLSLEPVHIRLQTPGPAQLALYFPLEPPTGAEVALEYLLRMLLDPSPGSLQATLRARGYAERVSTRRVYRAGAQALIAVDITGVPGDEAIEAKIVALLFSWLDFFAAQGDWRDARDQQARARSIRWQTCSALDALRMTVEQGDSAAIRTEDLAALLEQLTLRRLVSVATTKRDLPLLGRPGFALRARRSDALAGDTGQLPVWRLPQLNPYLASATAPPPGVPTTPAALQWYADDNLPEGHAALFLRWQWAMPVGGVFAAAVQSALAPITQAAGEAGIELRLQCMAQVWQLSLSGLAAALDRVLPDALKRLRQPSMDDWREASNPKPASPGGMLLRQLLEQLPNALQGPVAPVSGVAPEQLAQAWADLQAQVRWDAFGLGRPSAAIGVCLAQLPGEAHFAAPATAVARPARRWIESPGHAEQALLLFAAQPGLDAPAEAAWRLLGSLLQGAFYSHVRSDLQLGYGVYCGYRQVGGEAGLLFAVQSPNTAAARILEHLQAFLDDQRERLAQLSDAQLDAFRQPLAAQLLQPPASFRALAEARWSLHAQPGKQPAGQVALCVQQLTRAQLLDALDALRQARAGWLVLANAPRPDACWTLG